MSTEIIMTTFVAIIAWVVVAIVIGALGSKRKIGFAMGFILSLLLSPLIGAIFVATSPEIEPDKEAVRRPGNAENRTKKCPYCSEYVKNDANLCKHCGSDLPQNMPEQDRPQFNNTIHEAVLAGDWDGTKNAIDKGANVNEVNPDGKTALTLARDQGDSRIIGLLLNRGGVEK